MVLASVFGTGGVLVAGVYIVLTPEPSNLALFWMFANIAAWYGSAASWALKRK